MEDLTMVIEEFNTETTDNERTMAYYGQECNHNGTLVQVDTPWAMGFMDEQGVSLVA